MGAMYIRLDLYWNVLDMLGWNKNRNPENCHLVKLNIQTRGLFTEGMNQNSVRTFMLVSQINIGEENIFEILSRCRRLVLPTILKI